MQVGSAPAASRGEAFGQHAYDFIKFLSRQISKWISAADHFEQRILSPFLGRDRGDDLLRQNVEWLFGNCQVIEFAPTHRIEQRCAFQQLIARKRKDAALGKATD